MTNEEPDGGSYLTKRDYWVKQMSRASKESRPYRREGASQQTNQDYRTGAVALDIVAQARCGSIAFAWASRWSSGTLEDDEQRIAPE
jgi:hypothetical protein